MNVGIMICPQKSNYSQAQSLFIQGPNCIGRYAEPLIGLDRIEPVFSTDSLRPDRLSSDRPRNIALLTYVW